MCAVYNSDVSGCCHTELSSLYPSDIFLGFAGFGQFSAFFNFIQYLCTWLLL